MPITIEVPDDIAIAAKHFAKESGSDATALILDTLRERFLSFPAELDEEIRWWESASESDLAEFNRREGL